MGEGGVGEQSSKGDIWLPERMAVVPPMAQGSTFIDSTAFFASS